MSKIDVIKNKLVEQGRQSREPENKHAEQMAVLIEQVKVKDAEMKHFVVAFINTPLIRNWYVMLKHHLISVVLCGAVYDLMKRTLRIDTHQFPSTHIRRSIITKRLYW